MGELVYHYITAGWMDGSNRSGFEEALDVVEQELAAAPGGGPYFMGPELSLVGFHSLPWGVRLVTWTMPAVIS
jgi:hypothetical protein